jgi:hypothetical protein
MPGNPVQSSLNFELRESQNFFREKKVQLSFLRGTFLLYTLTLLPSVILILILYEFKLFKERVSNGLAEIFIAVMVGAICSYALGFSKIIARKFPVNYILYAVFVLSLMYTSVATGLNFEKFHPEVLFVMEFANGFGLLVYVLIAQKEFDPKTAFMVASCFQFVCLINFGFVFSTIIPTIMIYSLMSFVYLAIATFGAFSIVKNRNFDMLPSDYILGCLKIITVFPLVAHINPDAEESDNDPGYNN